MENRAATRVQDVEPSARPTNARAKTCKFFMAGKCRNGDKCAFVHPTQPPAAGSPKGPQSRARHVSPPRKPWKGKPVTRQSYVNDDGLLDPLDLAHFCAAGALLWYRNAREEPRMVMAVEERAPTGSSPASRSCGSSPHKSLERRYNFLGGKRDFEAESPQLVAAREVWEETGEQLSNAARRRIEQGGQPVAWVGSSKYALFAIELGDEDAHLVEAVAALGRRPDPVHDAHLFGVAWEPLRNLLDEGWCRRHLHEFAVVQAAAIRPVVRRLCTSAAPGVDDAAALLARATIVDSNGSASAGAASARGGSRGEGASRCCRNARALRRDDDEPSAQEEARVAADGVAYTKREFLEYYGRLDEWEAATASIRGTVL